MKMPAIPPEGRVPSCREIHVAGIHVNVFGLEHVKGSSQVNVAFFLHGRMGSAADLIPGIWHLEQSKVFSTVSGETPLLLVTLDHRNHGARLVDQDRNLSWAEGNQTHAQDMLSIQTGTAQDVSLVMDYLESILFPSGETSVSKWICTGASLGGHSTFISAAKDSRISHLVPLVGSPNMYELLRNRALKSDPPLGFEPPLMPDSLVAYMKRTDPAAHPEAFDGKSLLILSGGTDKLVNYTDGGNEALVKALQTRGQCEVEVWVQPKTGHKITKEMLEKVAFFLRKACRSRAPMNHL